MDPIVALLLVLLAFIGGIFLGIALTRKLRPAAADATELHQLEHDVAYAREEMVRAQTLADQLTQRLEESQHTSEHRYQVLATVQPLAAQLNQLSRQITALEEDRHQQFGSVNQQLHTGQQQQQQLLKITTELATAMKDNRARGHWGELALRRLLELAGLREGADFSTQFQTSVAGAEQDQPNTRHIPDIVVHLPGDRHIIIDAKTLPVGVSSEDAAATEAVNSLRQHIRDLGKKKYWESLPDATDFVVLFVPFDSQLASCLHQDSSLLEEALSRQVILAGPSTLFALLKNIASTWRQSRVSDQAQEILNLAQRFYQRITVLANHFESLGNSLNASVKHYNATIASLEKRLLPTGRELGQFLAVEDTAQELKISSIEQSASTAVAAELSQEPVTTED